MRNKVFLLITIIFILTGCSCADSEVLLNEENLNGQEDAAFLASDDTKDSSDEQDTETSGSIFVYVCGEVKCPGVYELDFDSRVIDAVSAAGGILDTADDTFVNLAAPLEDGIKLRIPSKEEIQAGPDGPKAEGDLSEEYVISKAITGDSGNLGGGNGLININTATAAELTGIPGIGESIAGKIVKYREENGKFSCTEDIMKISGIKDKLYQKIKDMITV
ncbi:MAG: helix-hairpin-helix domain-containing protein [Butyrivibrio sp.]|nr:helix-hairpin-helix domain-containing protein [Butyrivibrio sp.]